MTKVYVGNVNPGRVSVNFTKSLVQMSRADMKFGWNHLAGEIYALSGANISRQRNDIVRTFLENHPDGDWLLLLDSDMVFPPDTVARLLTAAEKADCQIIGGLCVMTGALGPVPTLYQFDDVPGSTGITRCWFDYPDNTVVQVAATGAACIMIHRQVLEDLRDGKFAWFREDVLTHPSGEEHWTGEDIYFTLRANDHGHRVFVDCTLEIGHDKGDRIWYASDIRKGIGIPRGDIAAVIPSKTSELVEPLIDQLLAQGACGVVVCDNGLTERRDDDRVVYLDSPDQGIHEMWNAGLEYALERWGERTKIFLVNDDVRLGANCLRTLGHALDDYPDYWVLSPNYDGRSWPDWVQPVSDICANRYDGTGGIAGFAMMVRGEWFVTGYRFPNECKWWYGDNDLVNTIGMSDVEDRRKRMGIVIAAVAEHVDGGGKSGGWSDPEMVAQLEADRVAYEAKWTEITARIKAKEAADQGDLAPLYELLCDHPSDINEHLPTLHDLAVKLDAQNVVELGVRGGLSATAWCAAVQQTGGRLWAVDIHHIPDELVRHPSVTFLHGDSCDPFLVAQVPDEVDVVFIDTDHTYQQTTRELETWWPKLRKGGAIALHDTAIEAHTHHVPPNVTAIQPPFPVMKAIEDFDVRATMERWDNNNGLVILCKQ